MRLRLLDLLWGHSHCLSEEEVNEKQGNGIQDDNARPNLGFQCACTNKAAEFSSDEQIEKTTSDVKSLPNVKPSGLDTQG